MPRVKHTRGIFLYTKKGPVLFSTGPHITQRSYLLSYHAVLNISLYLIMLLGLV